jgi:putative transposase
LADGLDVHQGEGRLEISLYRAVDKEGKAVDFLLTAQRDMTAAKRFFEKVMHENGVPDKVAIDKSGANKAAINEINGSRVIPITVRQINTSTT